MILLHSSCMCTGPLEMIISRWELPIKDNRKYHSFLNNCIWSNGLKLLWSAFRGCCLPINLNQFSCLSLKWPMHAGYKKKLRNIVGCRIKIKRPIIHLSPYFKSFSPLLRQNFLIQLFLSFFIGICTYMYVYVCVHIHLEFSLPIILRLLYLT